MHPLGGAGTAETDHAGPGTGGVGARDRCGPTSGKGDGVQAVDTATADDPCQKPC